MASPAADFLFDFALGGVSGAVSKTLTAPYTRILLLLQTQDVHPLVRSGAVPRHTGLFNCGKRIYAEQGFRRLWDGNFVNCIRYFPTQACNLAFKDAIRSFFPRYNKQTEFPMFFAASLASGLLASTSVHAFTYPLEYVHTRLACDVGSDPRTFRGLTDCVSRTVQGPRGFLGLYTGFSLSIAGSGVGRGFQLGLFDALVGLNPYASDRGVLGLVSTFGAAQAAIFAGSAFTYPLSLMCRRLQMQADKPLDARVYTGVANAVKKISAEEGLRGFYRAFHISATVNLLGAFTFIVYDRMKVYLGLGH